MSFQIHTLGFFYGSMIFSNHFFMRNKLLLALFAAIVIFTPQSSYAQERASQSSASIQLPEEIQRGSDYRVKILEKYLQKHNSPLAGNAGDFVFYADKYNLDWKFVAAISGLESTFGQQIPYNSYNAWGWGIYGDNMIRFNSWEEGIKTISQGLRERYIDRWGARNVYEIGSLYAASPTWAVRVDRFMNNIQEFALNNPQDTLSLSF